MYILYNTLLQLSFSISFPCHIIHTVKRRTIKLHQLIYLGEKMCCDRKICPCGVILVFCGYMYSVSRSCLFHNLRTVLTFKTEIQKLNKCIQYVQYYAVIQFSICLLVIWCLGHIFHTVRPRTIKPD